MEVTKKQEKLLQKAQESHVALEKMKRINRGLPKKKAKRFDAIQEVMTAKHNTNMFNLRNAK